MPRVETPAQIEVPVDMNMETAPPDKYLYLSLVEPQFEIINGRWYMVPAPGTRHQEISGALHAMLHTFVRRNHLGWVYAAPCDVELSDANTVQPDILFVSRGRRAIITEARIKGAPDLVVEILSPASMKMDRITKRQLYALYGVQEYWLVDPETETVEVLRPSDRGGKYDTDAVYGAGEVLESLLLPGLQVNVREIFARLE